MPPRRGRGPRRCGGSARRCARDASGGMPGPSSATANSSRPSRGRRGDVMASPGSVCATALRTRLRSTWVSRSGSASSMPARRPVTSEVALAEQRQVAAQVLEEVVEVDRLAAGPVRRPRRGQREHVVDEPVHLVELAAAASRPRGGARRHRRSRSSSSTWARSTVSGVRSSCEASETKSRWRANGALEPIEHAVERRRRARRPRRAAAESPLRSERSPASTPRGDARPCAAAAARSASRRQPADRERDQQRERADEREGVAAGSPARRRPAASGSATWSVPSRRPSGLDRLA